MSNPLAPYLIAHLEVDLRDYVNYRYRRMKPSRIQGEESRPRMEAKLRSIQGRWVSANMLLKELMCKFSEIDQSEAPDSTKTINKLKMLKDVLYEQENPALLTSQDLTDIEEEAVHMKSFINGKMTIAILQSPLTIRSHSLLLYLPFQNIPFT